MAPSPQDGRERRRIVLGRILAPFGVHGWVKIESFTDPPEQLLEFARWRTGDRRELRAVEGRRHGRGLVAKIEGIDDRESAAALSRGRPDVWVERAELPALGKNEHYRDDLIGFEAVNLQGERLGTVEGFLDLPANAVMIVKGAREHWLPLGQGQLLRVDAANRRVTVDWDREF